MNRKQQVMVVAAFAFLVAFAVISYASVLLEPSMLVGERIYAHPWLHGSAIACVVAYLGLYLGSAWVQ